MYGERLWPMTAPIPANDWTSGSVPRTMREEHGHGALRGVEEARRKRRAEPERTHDVGATGSPAAEAARIRAADEPRDDDPPRDPADEVARDDHRDRDDHLGGVHVAEYAIGDQDRPRASSRRSGRWRNQARRSGSAAASSTRLASALLTGVATPSSVPARATAPFSQPASVGPPSWTAPRSDGSLPPRADPTTRRKRRARDGRRERRREGEQRDRRTWQRHRPKTPRPHDGERLAELVPLDVEQVRVGVDRGGVLVEETARRVGDEVGDHLRPLHGGGITACDDVDAGRAERASRGLR